MRLPRVRFTVRRMMALVAVVALAIWARSQVEARRVRFDELTRQYYDRRSRASSWSYSGPGGAIMEERVRADELRRSRASEYYSGLIRKYERACRYPWLPVAADPIKPEGIDENRIVVE